MIDLSWSHILIILVVALVVVWLKDLPRLMRMMGQKNNREGLPDKLAERLNFSAGLASLPSHTEDKDELVRLADEAMYASKKAGRNQFTVAPLPAPKV